LHILAEAEFAGLSVFHRVRPEEITEETVEGRLNKSIDGVNVTLALQLRGNSTMHAQIVTVDVGRDGHGLESVNEFLVDVLLSELLEDLTPEGEVLSHCSRFVVATQHNHCFREV